MDILVIKTIWTAKVTITTTTDETNTVLTRQQLLTTIISKPTPTIKENIMMISIRLSTIALIQKPTRTSKDDFRKQQLVI